MYARPKPGETEEDLLRLQAEFERQKAESKIKPAATVVSNKTKGTVPNYCNRNYNLFNYCR